MKRTGAAALLLLFLGLFTRCSNQVESVDIGYAYFPTDLGRYYVYQVDSVFVDCAFGVRDTFHYQVKEYYDTLFTDLEGDPAIRLEVYRRPTPADSWAISDVWSVKKLPARVEKVEENNRYVKLTFPVEEGAAWDGNAYNYITNWGYNYTFGMPELAAGIGPYSFDSTVTVYQKVDTLNLISRKLYTETFARNVGMVHKTKIDITGIVSGSANDCSELLPPGTQWIQVPIMQRIASGSVVYYTLIDYGFE